MICILQISIESGFTTKKIHYTVLHHSRNTAQHKHNITVLSFKI